MAYQRVRDLIERVRSYHRRLRAAVERGSARESDERLSLLLGYIEEQEKALETALERGAPESDPAVLDTWLQFAPEVELEKSLDRLGLEEDLASSASSASSEGSEGSEEIDLVTRVARAEDGIVQLYALLEAASGAPRVRTFFASLKDMGDSARRRYARAQLESLEG